ncbi:hypothetical protein ACFLXE_04810 [Chloroflexota bacterium]
MAEPITAILTAAVLLNVATSLWKLTFQFIGDPTTARKRTTYKYRSGSKFDYGTATKKQYLLTFQGKRLVEVEPLDIGSDIIVPPPDLRGLLESASDDLT